MGSSRDGTAHVSLGSRQLRLNPFRNAYKKSSGPTNRRSVAPHLNKQGYPEQLEDPASAVRRGKRCVSSPVFPHDDAGPRRSSLSPRSSSTTWNLLLVLALFFLAVTGCQDPHAKEKAQKRGEMAGRADGLRAGDGDGHDSTYQPAKDAAYDAGIREAIAAETYVQRRSYNAIVLGSGFLFGFGLQYLVLYFLRRREVLMDIDWIVLPRDKTQIDLTQLLESQRPNDTP